MMMVVHREGGQGWQPSDYRIHWWVRAGGELASVNKSEHMLVERYDPPYPDLSHSFHPRGTSKGYIPLSTYNILMARG